MCRTLNVMQPTKYSKTVMWRQSVGARDEGALDCALCRHACQHDQRSAPAAWLRQSPAHVRREVWLVSGHCSNGERRYYSRTCQSTHRSRRAGSASKLISKSRKGPVEGRSWIGLHHHAFMTMVAYAFLQSCRIAQAGRKRHRLMP